MADLYKMSTWELRQFLFGLAKKYKLRLHEELEQYQAMLDNYDQGDQGGKQYATREEVVAAYKKATSHGFTFPAVLDGDVSIKGVING